MSCQLASGQTTSVCALRSPALRRAVLPQIARMLLALPALLALQPGARAGDVPLHLTAGSLNGDISGSLVIVGGGILPDEIRDRFLELAGGKKAHLVVIPTASEKADLPDQLVSWPRWKGANVASVHLLHTRKPEQANDPVFIKPLTTATAVWLTGGDQSKLIEAYRGTAVERELKRLLARGGVIGGTSAGAAVMSAVMIRGGRTAAEIGPGFGFLPGVVIDQHFYNRQRQARLIGVLERYPACPGIGIDEQTAIVVSGHSMTVLGNANVRVCFCPLGKEMPPVRVLKSGEKVDLVDVCRTAVARVNQPMRELMPLPKR